MITAVKRNRRQVAKRKNEKSKSIFTFTQRNGGFFSTQRTAKGIKATYNNGNMQPISAHGANFAEATENVMNLFYKLNV